MSDARTSSVPLAVGLGRAGTTRPGSRRVGGCSVGSSRDTKSCGHGLRAWSPDGGKWARPACSRRTLHSVMTSRLSDTPVKSRLPSPPLPPPPPPPPTSPPPTQPSSLQPQVQSLGIGCSVDDFKMYLGLVETARSMQDRRQLRRLQRQQQQQPMQHQLQCRFSDHSSASTMHQLDGLLCEEDPDPDTLDSGFAASSPAGRRGCGASSVDTSEDEEEESFFELIGLMLLHAERAAGQCRSRRFPGESSDYAGLGTVRRFATEFGDRVGRFHARGGNSFPFYQPEMLAMLDMLTGDFSASGSESADADALLVLTERLRSIHLHMRLFLRPEETLATGACGADDAAVARLILAYAEHVDWDLREASAPTVTIDRGGGGDANGEAADDDGNDEESRRRRRYAKRRVAALAAALGRYTRTAERRRRLILGRMRGLAASLGGYVVTAATRDCVTAGDYSQAAAGLYDRLVGCFDCLAGDPVQIADADVDAVTAAPVSADSATEAAATAAANSVEAVVDATLDPQESLALQLMERLEGLIAASFLPNERINAQEFKTAFEDLCRWWGDATDASNGGSGCVDRRVAARIAGIREQFNHTQRCRADAGCVKRLSSEAETAWDLLEAAKLLIPQAAFRERSAAARLACRTAPEWREATLGLVSSTLARLYLYQVAQDASVLSMRLRADLQRLMARLADCGPAAPPLAMLRLRLCYLRARQYSDLLRAHPQGCLILELAHAHRILSGPPAAPPPKSGAGPAGLELTLSVPLVDFKKFCQHLGSRELRVLSFEARAPPCEGTARLVKPSCLKKIEQCCQCAIELRQPGPQQRGGGGSGPVNLQIRPDASHGRASAAMRMIADIVGSGLHQQHRVKFAYFHVSLTMPHGYRPLAAFADTSRPLND